MPAPAINILYYEPTSGYGGSSRCLLSWLKKIDRRCYTPIVAVHYDGPVIKKIKALGIKVIKIPFRSGYIYNAWAERIPLSYLLAVFDLFLFTIPSALFLFALIKIRNIQLAHLNSKPFGVVPGIIAAKLAGKPCICHLHDIKIPIKREKYLARWVDCLVALTGKARDLYCQVYSNNKIKLITNGIDLDEYVLSSNPDHIKQELGLGVGDKIVGVVGRLVQGKGFTDFLAAAKILNNKEVDLRYIIVGAASKEDRQYEDRLRQMAVDQGLGQKVIFTGWREDAKKIMRIFDVLIQPSSTFPEGFGMTVLEAMALGKPVIVTDVPGPGELVINGQTGLIVPPANPSKLAEAIEIIIKDRILAADMGISARRHAEIEFNIENTVKKLECLYAELLGKEGCHV